MNKKELIEIFESNVDLAGLLVDLIEEGLEPALKKAVEKSPNKFDDMLFASLYPLVAEELKDLIKEGISSLFLKLKEDEAEAQDAEVKV